MVLCFKRIPVFFIDIEVQDNNVGEESCIHIDNIEHCAGSAMFPNQQEQKKESANSIITKNNRVQWVVAIAVHDGHSVFPVARISYTYFHRQIMNLRIILMIRWIFMGFLALCCFPRLEADWKFIMETVTGNRFIWFGMNRAQNVLAFSMLFALEQFETIFCSADRNTTIQKYWCLFICWVYFIRAV